MTTEPNTAQSIVDGQLAELQITSAEVTGDTYKEQHDAKIKALDEEEASIPAPTDKASLQRVQDFITKSEKARTGIDKFRKAFKDRWKPMLDAVDAYLGTTKENGRQAEIYAIQQRAEAKKKAYLDEQAKAQREADRLLEERYTGRVAKLTGAGMTFDAAGNLTIRDGEQTMSVLPTQVRFFDDAQFDKGLERVQAIAHKIREAEAAALQAKEAQEREEAEERERLRVQREDQDAAAAKLKADREEFEREKAALRKAKNEMRAVDLETLGGTWRTDAPARIEFGGTSLPVDSLADFDDAKWQEVRGWVRDAKVKAIEEQKERERRNTNVKTRSLVLMELGIPYDGNNKWELGDAIVSDMAMGAFNEEEWAPVLARFKEAAEARDRTPSQNGYVIDADCHKEIVPAPAPIEVDHSEPEWKSYQKTNDRDADLSQPLQEGSAVVVAQPDLESGVDTTTADAVEAEATTWGTGRLAYHAGYRAGYRAAMREI